MLTVTDVSITCAVVIFRVKVTLKMTTTVLSTTTSYMVAVIKVIKTYLIYQVAK